MEPGCVELSAALEALSGGSPRRAFRQLLAAERDEAARERWERFRLVAPSRVDVPIDGDGLSEEKCYALLEGLGLVAAILRGPSSRSPSSWC